MQTCPFTINVAIWVQIHHSYSRRELASADDELPLWDSSGHVEASAQRSPLLRSVMQPQNDGIGASLRLTLHPHFKHSPPFFPHHDVLSQPPDDVTGFLGTASISASHAGSPLRRATTQAALNKKSDGRCAACCCRVLWVFSTSFAGCRWIGLFSLECGSVRLVMLVTCVDNVFSFVAAAAFVMCQWSIILIRP
jgi:hypothetical protein